MVKASELLKKIQAGEWEAEVVDDDDCYPELFSAALEAEGDGSLSLIGRWGYREDSPRHGVSFGRIVVKIDGVKFSAERIAEGELDEWEVSGEEIDYDGDLQEDDLTSALEDGELPHYSPDDYEFDDCEVTASDLKDVCDSYPEYLVETEDGELLGFDDEDDVPEGAQSLDLEDMIDRLFDDGSVSYESMY